ncbi:hypothetical protein JO84_gp134 [Aureococcus anophagefferens virus]|uniref:Uncharacterized protein n=1 Tax=Aureococcus anophagefferens virus TaxID=1474867 RepID=A0A076FG91_9VIRU|nr:hypothetical protein JO84_gp134 [Aureococcus anophagefferens virus]AII17090.1 hypothetical protein AaV_346 [Aureococcus anophagefferens virus]UOG94256.1 hypothetical protein MKD35_221 [Aureococcus anophagefferens virus]
MGCVPSKKRDELSASKKRVELSATTEWAIRLRDTKVRARANGDYALARVLEKHWKDIAKLLDEEQRGEIRRNVDSELVDALVDKLQDYELKEQCGEIQRRFGACRCSCRQAPGL